MSPCIIDLSKINNEKQGDNSKMKPSIQHFAANFQALNTKQLSKIVGGNGYVTAAAPTKRRPFR